VRMGAKNSDVYLRCLILKSAAMPPEEWLFQEFKTCKKGEYYTSLASFPPSMVPEGISIKCMQVIHHSATIVFNNLCGLRLIEAKKRAPRDHSLDEPLEPQAAPSSSSSSSTVSEKDLTTLLMNLASFEAKLDEVKNEGEFPLGMYYFLKLQTILCRAEGYKLLSLSQQSIIRAKDYVTISEQIRGRDLHLGIGVVWGDQTVLELFRQLNRYELMARHLEVMKNDSSGFNAVNLVRKAYLPLLKCDTDPANGSNSCSSTPATPMPFSSPHSNSMPNSCGSIPSPRTPYI